MGAGLRDERSVGVQAVHEVAVAGMERGGQGPVAAAEVDDEAALDACRRQDLLGRASCPSQRVAESQRKRRRVHAT